MTGRGPQSLADCSWSQRGAVLLCGAALPLPPTRAACWWRCLGVEGGAAAGRTPPPHTVHLLLLTHQLLLKQTAWDEICNSQKIQNFIFFPQCLLNDLLPSLCFLIWQTSQPLHMVKWKLSFAKILLDLCLYNGRNSLVIQRIRGIAYIYVKAHTHQLLIYIFVLSRQS